MKLSIGIVGLPNVGKSTLFNAITNASVEAQNYPFCTIEPNVGIVPVPDARLRVLAEMNKSQKITHSTIEFVDIAGLVQGASKGEGLGNKFLANIRETSAIAHIVRCFEDPNITHVHGSVDPMRDVEIINLELILADYDTAQKLVASQSKKAKGNNKDEIALLKVLERIEAHLGQNKPVRQLEFSEAEQELLKGYMFLTQKKVIYVGNVSEDMLGTTNAAVDQLRAFAESEGDQFMLISARLEEELSQLSEDEKLEYLQSLGLAQPGLDLLAQKCYKLLGLQTYLTTGPKETRAWTIYQGDTAPKAAGVIHTDFERGFIRANIIKYEDYLVCGDLKTAREKGMLRQEGKEYVMQEGDIVEFLFNV